MAALISETWVLNLESSHASMSPEGTSASALMRSSTEDMMFSSFCL